MRPKIDWPSRGDAAVDDHQVGDSFGHAIGHQAGDQAAEAVADQHDIAEIVALEDGQRVGEKGVIVDIGGKFGRAFADAEPGEGAGVMPRGVQALEHELPRPGAHPGAREADVSPQLGLLLERETRAEPAGADEDQVDAEEDAQRVEAGVGPMGHDHQPE